MHDRRRLAAGAALLALLAIVISPFVATIVRTPAFHDYVDTRALLVLSNLPFIVVGLLSRRAPLYLRGAVAAIGVGSGAYHWAPGDTLLALDWAPIALTLMLLAATVIHDRAGARAGRLAFQLAPILALGSVTYWLATGGTTSGGNMAPYVTTQAVGVVVPPIIATLAPGAIKTRWLVVGVIGFVLARGATAYDRVLLETLGISGHSIKHVLAALAAACALRATYKPIQ